jgi:sortase A
MTGSMKAPRLPVGSDGHQGAPTDLNQGGCGPLVLSVTVSFRLSHRTARVVAAIGRILITVGTVTLLFVAYQLWGTGLQHARAQDQMRSEFEAALEAAAVSRPEPSPTTAAPRAVGSSDEVDLDGNGNGNGDGDQADVPPEGPGEDPQPDLRALAPVRGEPVARIEIPSIGVDETVVFGISVADLRKGPGVFPDNPMPGTSGNSAIAGHRTTYGAPFHDLDRVRPGDQIVVTTLQGEFTYEVMAHPAEGAPEAERGYFIVPAAGVEVLDDHGDDRLTLVACHPKYSARQRIIVTGVLVDEPVEAPPPPEPTTPDVDGPTPELPTEPDPVEPDGETDWGDGLEGDPEALVPSVAWGGLFVLGLAGAWTGGRLWRRWPVYLLAVPILGWLMWSWFVHLDRLLPAY